MWQEYFRALDAFLMPTAFVPAFPHDQSEASPGPAVSRLDDRVIATAKGPRPYWHMFFWISFATLTGLPATTAPVGLTTVYPSGSRSSVPTWKTRRRLISRAGWRT
jgi:amidase